MNKSIDTAQPAAVRQKGRQFGKSRVNRQILTTLHRWAGLFLAVFLFISGLTGAIISWDHELDE